MFIEQDNGLRIQWEWEPWSCAIWQTHTCANNCTKHFTQILSINSHNKTLYKQLYCMQFPMQRVRLREMKHLSQSHTATTWEKNFINYHENQQDYREVLCIGEMHWALGDLSLRPESASHQICWWANPFPALSLGFLICKMGRLGQFMEGLLPVDSWCLEEQRRESNLV